jgi:hypothetical protein
VVKNKVKKLKTESQYKRKYEGNKVQFLLNSELLEELTRSIWTIDNSKVEYAHETITEVIDAWDVHGTGQVHCTMFEAHERADF